MTEHSEKVREQKFKIDAEEWGKKVKFYHYNNGIREMKFNNGISYFEDTKTEKKWTVYPEDYKLSLLENFSRWLVDRKK
jgi:hypothetical protein